MDNDDDSEGKDREDGEDDLRYFNPHHWKMYAFNIRYIILYIYRNIYKKVEQGSMIYLSSFFCVALNKCDILNKLNDLSIHRPI